MSQLTDDLNTGLTTLLASGQAIPASKVRQWGGQVIAAIGTLEARARGNTIHYTSGVPGNALGQEGDLGVNKLTGDYYQYTGGQFVFLFNGQGRAGVFTPIPANQFGTHPPFASQDALNTWLLANRGAGSNSGGTTAPGTSSVILLLMAGQSNCLGVGAISEVAGSPMAALTPDPLREFQRVMIWNPGTSAFEKLHAGVNNLAASAGHFGAEIGLAQRWEDVNPTGVLYLVKDPRDGRPIADWDKTNANGTGGYAELVARVNAAKAALTAAGKTPVTKGFIWSQGESNAGDTAYASKLQTFINNLTLDTIVDTGTKLVISKVRSDATVGQQDDVFVQNNASKAVGVNTANYAMNGDNLHYNYRAQFLSGYTDFYNPIFGLQSAYPFPMTGSAVVTPPASGGTATTASMEQDDSRVAYSPGFVAGSSGQDSGGTNETLANADGWAGFSFTGTAVALDFADFGGIKFEVWIDGSVRGFVASNGSQALAERFGLSGLANTTHHVQLVSRASDFATLWVDRLRCAGTFVAYAGPTTLPPAPQVVGAGNTEENNAAWSYFDASGNPTAFTQASGPPTSNVHALYTQVVGSRSKIQFAGTGFSLTHFYLSGGFATAYDVVVDGTKIGSVGPPSDGSAFGVMYTSPTLASGIHTLELVCTGMLIVDLLTVTD